MELEIANYTQVNLTIEKCYSGFLNLWSEYFGIIHAKVLAAALSTMCDAQEVSEWDQFLMKLGPEFEVVRAGLLNCDPVPSLDVCLGELLREEQWLASQSNLGANISSSDVVTFAYIAQGRGKGKLWFFYCEGYGHIARTCPQTVCIYCK